MHQLIWIGTASEAPQSRKKCVKLHFKLTGNPTVYSVHIWKVNALGLPEYVCGIDPEEVHARVSEARFQRFPLDMICEKCLGVVATRYQLSTDPKAAYSDEQLCDELANALRNEGFEASKQVVNGEIGVLIGPKGLNPLRMPPGQRAIFFPHQELTDKANRALVARRDFHEFASVVNVGSRSFVSPLAINFGITYHRLASTNEKASADQVNKSLTIETS